MINKLRIIEKEKYIKAWWLKTASLFAYLCW